MAITTGAAFKKQKRSKHGIYTSRAQVLNYSGRYFKIRKDSKILKQHFSTERAANKYLRSQGYQYA